MKIKMVKVTELNLGDKLNFWGEIRTITEIEISESGKTIRFNVTDSGGNAKLTTWWRITNTVERIL